MSMKGQSIVLFTSISITTSHNHTILDISFTPNNIIAGTLINIAFVVFPIRLDQKRNHSNIDYTHNIGQFISGLALFPPVLMLIPLLPL
jgi:hypothetical protein